MAITSGSRLGPYEVVSPLGAGGMGEVWKARDTRLDRSVAIKVLPAEFAENAQLKLRFEREAKTISQLNHPHICTLYDVGVFSAGPPSSAQDRGATPTEVPYLVMELLEGESLADRLSKGPLPLDQVLRYGIEIAQALDKAHKAGIVHRDLKPGNIMITKSGAKLLDFGLAKPASVLSLQSSVLTNVKPLTSEGSLVGTFQYMAPEQIEGGEVDARTDIFALGAVLYEMATGKRAFSGKSNASLIANILGAEPQPVSAIVPVAPEAFDRIVRTCLAKEPDERLQSAHDIAQELRWAKDVPPPRAQRTRSVLPWLMAAAFAAALLGAGAAWIARPRPHVIESAILPPPTRYSFNAQISPDGSKIVFPVADANVKRKLVIRSLDSGTFKEVEGSENGGGPFWSRDSRTLYFFTTGGTLLRMPSNGGPAEKLAAFDAQPHGGSVNDDRVILVGADADIKRLDPSGKITVVSRHRAGEAWRAWPWFLPDGKHFLYWTRTTGDHPTTSIGVTGLDGSVDKTLAVSESRAMFVPQGYVVYAASGQIVAQKFDLRRLELRDDPIPLAPAVSISTVVPGSLFSVSDTGSMIYRAAYTTAGNSQLTWFDDNGHQLETLDAPQGYWDVAISHDGKRLAVRIGNLGGIGHLWLYDIARKVSTRFTAGDDDESAPIWSSDDRSIFFSSSDGYEWRLYRRPAGSEQPVLLSRSKYREFISSVSPDGKFLLVHAQTAGPGAATIYNTYVMSLGDGKRTRIGHPQFQTMSAKFSPDGHWIAYSSDESDRAEIYVQHFPDGAAKTRISTEGGTLPIWGRDGTKLYYRQPDDKIVVVNLQLGATVEPGKPQPLLTAILKSGPNQQFDVAPDGKRILANVRSGDDYNTPYTFIQNWTAKLP